MFNLVMHWIHRPLRRAKVDERLSWWSVGQTCYQVPLSTIDKLVLGIWASEHPCTRQYKIIMHHGFILRHTIHTIFFGFFLILRTKVGQMEFWCERNPLSSSFPVVRRFLPVVAFIVLPWVLQKAGSIKGGRGSIAINSHNSTPVQSYIVSTSDVAFLVETSKNDRNADAVMLWKIVWICSVHDYVGFNVSVTHNRTLKIRSNLSIIWS
jgi:hypothetical protein